MVSGSISNKERIIWITLLIVMAVIAALIIVKYQTALTLVKQSEADLTARISNLPAQSEKGALPQNNPDIISGLKQQGFDGSVEDLKNDLIKHADLIPYEGVLGGNMGFYSTDNIFVLSDKWVFAYFDDGHINGYMLLSYSVNNNTISWKVIDSYLFGQ